MSRINTNVNSLIAQNSLAKNQNLLSTSLERLSTGLRINSGADDPAGLIASQQLQSSQASLTAALGNAQSADQIVGTAEGGLGEVNSLLTQIQGLVTSTSNNASLTSDEKAANQLQIDSILQSIDRIAATTSFQGTNLLNGNYDFQVTGQSNKVTDLQVNAATIPAGSTVPVNAIITGSAQHGTLYLSAGGTQLHLTNAAAQFSFDLGGALGTKQFTFASGTTLANVAAGVDTYASVTGVSAVASGNYLKIKSTSLGSNQFVSFQLVNRGGQAGGLFFASATNENKNSAINQTAFTALSGAAAVRGTGADVAVTINGTKASTQGTQVSINTSNLNANFALTTAGAQTLGSLAAFTVAGGGAQFNLGPSVNVNNQVRVGIGNVATYNLGSSALGYLNSLASGGANSLSATDLGAAQNIVSKAITQVANLRGRLGAFQDNVVGSTIDSLNVALENTSAAESQITDTDFAAETSNLTRAQVLVAAAQATLGIAKNTPSSVLQLLQQ